MEPLPYIHATKPAFRTNDAGLTVICDGPHTIYLDGYSQVRCTQCSGLLVRVAE